MLSTFKAALLAATLLFAPQSGMADPAAPASFAVQGFRSAQFGMTEAETRKAIAHDFLLWGTSVKTVENPLQGTEALSISVPGLVPASGKAEVDYVFGYKSQKLVQVNVVWSAATDPSNTSAALVHTGVTLAGYFKSEPWSAGKTASGALLGNGNLLLFRGTDGTGHAVILLLGGTLHQATATTRPALTPTVLSLGYAADPDHPDVFQLQKGAF